ncbi:MAG: radical SAM protein [Anaerolineaceae bacterium]
MNKLHYFNITYLCDSDCLFCAANAGIINAEGYTIDANSFENDLLESHVSEDDRIIVSGGEPTLSPYFWEILDICEKHGCCIDLTTNGHFFSDKSNVFRISQYRSIVVRIPIFGLQVHHDYLTGRQGGYIETLDALQNFSQIANSSNITVNVKFLLCKATIKSNPEAFAYLFNRFGTLFEYTLSPILVSKKAILYKTILLAPYSELVQQSVDFIESRYINCDIVPLCVLPHNKRNTILSSKHVEFEKMYTDAQINTKDMGNFNCNSCDNCRLIQYCDKFLPSYIEYFGSEEIKPF